MVLGCAVKTPILLSALLAPYYDVPEGADRSILNMTSDSRCVVPGHLFVACCPPLGHGEPYITEAVNQGAVAILRQSTTNTAQIRFLPTPQGTQVPEISLPHLAPLIGPIASAFYQHPSQRMTVIGITGTNGKTTISFLLAQAFTALGEPAAVLGTLGCGRWDQLKPSHLTTPMPIELQQLLETEYKEGVKTLAMEVSSHSLTQHRVAGVQFHTAVFTNLSRDHLDYHGTMEEYGLAKKQLFLWPHLKTRVINLDDEFGATLAAEFQDQEHVLLYTQQPELAIPQRTIFIREHRYSAHGIEAHVVTPWGDLFLKSPLLGAFNASNLLATIAVLLSVGYSPEQIQPILPQLQGAPGRMQVLAVDGFAKVIIDYAHTPDALQKALQAIRQHSTGQIFCVFGCGGDRDKGKRPLMAQVAEQDSDYVVVTSDNPRCEAPLAIIDDILAGFSNVTKVHTEPDRHIAIQWVLKQAKPQDVILLAGKGHENYQIINDECYHFSDAEQVVDATKTMNKE